MKDREILRVIGRNIKRARLQANLTQECLAEIIGVHWQTVSYLESGKYPFSVTTFARISQVLDVSANRLLDGLSAVDREQIDKVKKVLARKRKPPKQKAT